MTEEITPLTELGAEAHDELMESMYRTQNRDAKSSIQRWKKALEPFKAKGYGFYLLSAAAREVEPFDGYSHCAVAQLFPGEYACIQELNKLVDGEDAYADYE